MKKTYGRLLLLGKMEYQHPDSSSPWNMFWPRHTHTHTHTQVYETMFSRQCTSSDNKQQYPKSVKHLRCVPCDYCYSLFLEKSFQLHRERMPRSSQVNYLTWGDRGEDLGARVHSTEYWRGKKWTEMETLSPAESLIHAFSIVQAYEETIPGRGKNHLKDL